MRRDELRNDSWLLDLFVGGPSVDLQRLLRLGEPNLAHLKRRALALVAIGWLVPLLLLAVRAVYTESDSLLSFANDIAVHARSLIAVPVFVIAEVVTAPRLGASAVHFIDAGIVPEAEYARFDEIISSTLRLRNSRITTLVVTLTAYAIVFALLRLDVHLTAWQRINNEFSPAGWWHAVVSVPLLLVLVLSWFWRVSLWARFLWLVANLDLRLIPANPDNAAGLRFLGYSLRAYSILGLGFGTMVAGGLANKVARTGATLPMFVHTALVLVAFVVVLFAAPLLVFLPRLLHVWRRGVLQYGGLANKLGREFEDKWFREDAGPLLEVPDFSAAIDLYSVVDYVYQMRFVPIDLASLIILVAVTLLPFIPVLFIGFPLEVLEEFVKLLF